MAKYDQKAKFAEVKEKLESFCSRNTEYKVDYNEMEDRFSVLKDGMNDTIFVSVGKDKVTSTDNEFLMKVVDFVAEAGKYLPAVLNDAEKNEISILFADNPIIEQFRGLRPETLMHSMAPSATPQEFIEYLMRARLMGLNPLLPGEFYFIKNKNGDVYHHVGVNAFKRKAAENPDLAKYEYGVIVAPKGKLDSKIEYREGELFMRTREDLLGGWCKVYLKSRAADDPIFEQVAFEEYDTGMSNWVKKPGTMICKVAQAHGLRHADPNLRGMLIAEELGIDPSREVKSFYPGSELSQEQVKLEAVPVEVT